MPAIDFDLEKIAGMARSYMKTFGPAGPHNNFQAIENDFTNIA